MRIRMIYSIVAAGLLAGSVLGARSQAQDSPLPEMWPCSQAALSEMRLSIS